MLRIFIITACLSVCCGQTLNQKATGYRGIWYSNQPSGDQYAYKYSGGFATYPQQQGPIAIYAPAVRKTFFVYGGATPGNSLLHMVSYFDHETGTVPRPTILLDKKTDDAHDNPVLSIDAEGHLWVFSNSHGLSRPSYIHRSRKPYDIDSFELVRTTNFTYGNIWHLAHAGFLFLHTLYHDKGRSLYLATSPDGRKWSEPTPFARFGLGHYQISARSGNRIATVFDYHPDPAGLNYRTNLYYLQTTDYGRTWQTVTGRALALPLQQADTPALVHNYESSGLKVYIKDLTFDPSGNPVILYLTTSGYESGPRHGQRRWHTARWTGKSWVILPVTTSDHNYDHGSLYIESARDWRIIAPTAPGPRPYTTGGEMVLWQSRNQGRTWRMRRQLTRDSATNHTYAKRPIHAHRDFYGLWADGETLQAGPSRLYFANQRGDVFVLPTEMSGDSAKPALSAPSAP